MAEKPIEAFRGDPTALKVSVPTMDKVRTYGLREDKTPKGPGFFGEISRTDKPEMFSTELSMTAGVQDRFSRDRAFPLLVPTLSSAEIAHLIDGGKPTQSIMKKAIEHAEGRIAAGLSPFAKFGEQTPLPK